jgi:1-acyl-sn-glycerol-3-phosphate acyltransferase
MAVGRDALIGAITTFLALQDPRTQDEVRESLEREIDDAGPGALAHLNERLDNAGADWSYSPSDPLTRRIHHVLADKLLKSDSAMVGVERAAAVATQPVVIFANHLSYADANLLEIMLQRSGGTELADRLTVIAGPKVYSSLKRRFSSLCFGTIKTPQNSARSSEDAVMNPREVARAARLSIDIAHERLARGEALLVFAEGTRSRSNGMQPLLAGASRYLDGPGTWILPVGIIGTEALFPVGGEALNPVRIETRIGRAIPGSALQTLAGGDRRLMMDIIGLAIAELLPVEYRGAYGDDAIGLEEPKGLLVALRRQA